MGKIVNTFKCSFLALMLTALIFGVVAGLAIVYVLYYLTGFANDLASFLIGVCSTVVSMLLLSDYFDV